MGRILIRSFIFFSILLQGVASAAKVRTFKKTKAFAFEGGFDREREASFKFGNQVSSIHGGAFQLTPDTVNDADVQIHYNKSGRIMHGKPFRLWMQEEDETVASFNTTFLINVFRKPNWDAGHGLAFLIAPNSNVPVASHGQWLGLTNATTDGDRANHIVAVEFDTEKQDFDPDDNHIGLNVNSIRSQKTVSLVDYDITISPASGTNYSVWVDYNGASKVIEVYMAGQDAKKPDKPLLSESLNLKQHVKQDSYFGFAASTGNPQIELNCVLKWTMEIDDIPIKKNKIWMKIVFPVAAASTILCLIFYAYKRKIKRGNTIGDKTGEDEFGKLRLPGMPREFKYKELKKATDDFDERMKLGEGGFGIVYKGILEEDDQNCSPKEIAVKRFSRDNIKGKDDFLAELTIIHHLRHKHLVKLVGWCYEKGKLLLVYDFMPNGSLEKHLYAAASGHSNTLNWGLRSKILAGIASALHYLHNEYDKKVVHRDLKASNILLDSDYNARLGDFGLARTLEDERNSYAEMGLAGVPGTMGYVAPECFHTGSATPESDVYGFGAVVLEVVCGRNPAAKVQFEQHLCTLVDWVWMLHRDERIQDAVDEKLGDDYETDEAKKLLLLGLACSHPVASERPLTEDLLPMMTGTLPVPRVPPFKPVFTWPSTNTETSLSSMTLSSKDISGTHDTRTLN